jgi:predicted nucleotidyltransferase
MSNSLDHLLTGEERQAIEAFVTELYQQYPDRVQDVILFGSKARGEGHPDSDGVGCMPPGWRCR